MHGTSSRASKKVITLYDRARFLEIRFYGVIQARTTELEFDGGPGRTVGPEAGYVDQVAFRNAKDFDVKYKVVAIRTH